MVKLAKTLYALELTFKAMASKFKGINLGILRLAQLCGAINPCKFLFAKTNYETFNRTYFHSSVGWMRLRRAIPDQ